MGATYSSGRIAKVICDRCQVRHPYMKLSSDPNSPGLRVCRGCKDQLDPYRLSPRKPDNFTLRFPRPDPPLIVTSVASGHVWNGPGLTWNQVGLTWN